MSEIETPSEINLKRMLSLVLHTKLSKENVTETSQDEKTNIIGNKKINQAVDEILSIQSYKRRPKNPNVLTRLIKLEDPTLVVTIGAVTFNVNMEVLEAYSIYFSKRNEAKTLVLPEDHVSQTAFTIIYEWMISDKPSLPRKGIVELYKAAVFLEIPQLLAQFWKCLSNPLIVEDNAFLLYLEALAFEAPQVREAMLGRISRFFLCIVACEEFLHLPVADLCMLFRSDLIGVNAELEIYFACVRYFDFDWEIRSPQLLEVMRTIRLDFLPTEFVLELLNRESSIDTANVIRMMLHPKLQDSLRDLMHYHCLAAFPGPNLVPIRKSNQRHWIFDMSCEYHDKQQIRFALPHFVQYSNFCNYLKVLCIAGPKHWEDFQAIELPSDLIANNNLKQATADQQFISCSQHFVFSEKVLQCNENNSNKEINANTSNADINGKVEQANLKQKPAATDDFSASDNLQKAAPAKQFASTSNVDDDFYYDYSDDDYCDECFEYYEDPYLNDDDYCGEDYLDDDYLDDYFFDENYYDDYFCDEGYDDDYFDDDYFDDDYYEDYFFDEGYYDDTNDDDYFYDEY